MSKLLLKSVLNLNYVKVDGDRAHAHWALLAESIQYDSMGLFKANHDLFVTMKAVAGLLGHRRHQGWNRYRLRERIITRRISRGEV